MKKLVLMPSIIFIFVFSFAQQQHNVVVRNIEVPLRVFDGELFVDDLNIEDIDLFEDGKPQKIQALYLINNASQERKEGEREFLPFLPRNFYFVFQLTEYNPEMKDALDYFFSEIYRPGDKVDILTKNKEYAMSAEALESNTKDEVVEYINEVIRNDTNIASKEYKKLMRDLKRITLKLSSYGGSRSGAMESSELSGGTGVEFILTSYIDALRKLEELYKIEEKALLRFSFQLKKVEGQKIVFFFFERENRPEINHKYLDTIMSGYAGRTDIVGQIQEIFSSYKEVDLNAARIEHAYADSSIQFNFLYINKKPDYVFGMVMRERSTEIKDIFSGLAHATGGIANDSSNPQDALRHTADATCKNYLVYYSPTSYVSDGKFKNIEIRVKNMDYKIHYRNGYIAD